MQWTQQRNGSTVRSSSLNASEDITIAYTNGTAFLVQYDASGSFEWVWSNGVNATINDIAHTPDKSIIVVGEFTGSVDFDPSFGGNTTATSAGFSDAFMAKYDSLGNFLWVNTWGNVNQDAARFVEVSGAEVFVSGFYRGLVDFDPGAGVANETAGTTFNEAFLAKYDTAGNYLASFAMTTGVGGGSQPVDMVIDASTNVYLAVDYTVSLQYDTNGTSQGAFGSGSSLLLARYNSGFGLSWKTDFNNASAVDISVNSSDLYLVGTVTAGQTIDMDPGAGSQNITSSGGSTAFLGRYVVGSGAYAGSGELTGDWPVGSSINAQVNGLGQLYVAGDFTGVVDFDPGPGSILDTSVFVGAVATEDIFIARYDAGLAYHWHWSAGSTSTDESQDVQFLSNGDFYLLGNFRETVDLDFGSGEDTLSSGGVGSPDIFVALYDTSQPCLLNAQLNGAGGLNSYCSGSSLTLHASGYQAGMSFSWRLNGSTVTGSTDSLVVNVPGTYTVVMSSAACSDSADIAVVENAPPTVATSLSSSFVSICESATAFIIGPGSPHPGSTPPYNGTLSISGAFTPPVDTSYVFLPQFNVGTSFVTYSYTDPITGCSNSVTDILLVNVNPTVTFSAVPDICDNDTLIPLNQFVSPVGGVFVGTGVQNDTVFNPAIIGSVPRLVTYNYTDSAGCIGTADTFITVNPSPTVSLNLPDTIFCETDGVVSLIGGSPTGGQYFDLNGNVISGKFVPLTAGIGRDTIFYRFEGLNRCVGFANDFVEVKPNPTVSFGTAPSFCSNQDGDTLDFGIPAGGTWSGLGVNNDSIFDPSTFGLINGDNNVLYTYVDSNGCSATDTSAILVKAPPVVSFNMAANFCDGEEPVSLLFDSRVFANPLGGTFIGPGVFGANSDSLAPGPLATGTIFDITYAYTDAGGCSDTGSGFFTVHETPTFSFDGGTVCNGIASRVGVVEEYFYEWNTGDKTQNIEVNITEPTTFTVTVFDFFCSSSDSILVELIETPLVTANLDSASGPYNNPLVDIDPLANDIGNFSSYEILFRPSNGSLDFGGSSTVFDYTPNEDFRRTDTMVYKVCDQVCFDICDTGIVFLRPYGDPHDFIPNAFTPNGDLTNEFFVIPGIEAPEYAGNEFAVFNVHGNLVYKATDYMNQWDGSPQGNILPGIGGKVPDGTYYYILKLAEDDVLTGFLEVRTK